MKIPQNPPRFAPSEAFEAIQRMGSPASALVDGAYVHWDKLRHLNPPETLTCSQWWQAIKWARDSSCSQIGFSDAEGRPFTFNSPSPLPQSLHGIDLNAGGMIQVPHPHLNRDMADRYIVRSLIEEAITSSQIEGAATTRRVAKQMIRTGRLPRDRSEQMILNNYSAMRQIVSCGKDADMSIERLLELHAVLCEDTFNNPEEIGRFRRPDENIRVVSDYGDILHTPPPADSLAQRVQAMCDFANGKSPDTFIHPVIRAIALHFWLAYDHPFTDGNGRCARALFYWSMLRSGYWLAEFISISEIIRKAPVQYGRAFAHTESDDNDLTYFIVYHIDLIDKAIKRINDYVRKTMGEQRRTERLIRAQLDLNHRQKAVLSHALRHPEARYSIQSHQTSHDVVYETARQDLLSLVDLGLLSKGKSGRSWYFEPVADLQSVLSGD